MSKSGFNVSALIAYKYSAVYLGLLAGTNDAIEVSTDRWDLVIERVSILLGARRATCRN